MKRYCQTLTLVDDEQMPCVGIFWYDPEDNTLFGVRKKELTPRLVGRHAEVKRGRLRDCRKTA